MKFVFAIVLFFCSLSTSVFAQEEASPTGPSSMAISPPSSGAYFGAWVNPDGTKGATAQEVEGYTETLETQISRKLSLHMHYYPWSVGNQPSFPGEAMTYDITNGRIPVVTWACGDSDANVVSGADDALITQTATAIKNFGSPIFLRWYWEMNLAPGANNQNCLGTEGAAGYVAAWQHIHHIFADVVHVTNVTWLWNPSGGSSAPDPSPYYPGSQYVDWIGFDGYDTKQAHDFGIIFDPFYKKFEAEGKPFLIAETGECPSWQSDYLSLAQSEIEGSTNPGGYAFPLVKGFMYFDAPGHYGAAHPDCAWSLEANSPGLAAFGLMGASPYFNGSLMSK